MEKKIYTPNVYGSYIDNEIYSATVTRETKKRYYVSTESIYNVSKNRTPIYQPTFDGYGDEKYISKDAAFESLEDAKAEAIIKLEERLSILEKKLLSQIELKKKEIEAVKKL